MEKANTAVEEDSHTNDIGTPVPKSLRSIVQINSISIDLGIPMPKKEEGKCQHFSLRGYVAEMRGKDLKICSPFASAPSDCTTISEEQLAPLDVPKFRWWKCGTCIHEIIGEESDEILSTSFRSRSNMASSSATESIFSVTKHESTSRKSDRNKAVTDDSPNTGGKSDKGRCTIDEDKVVTSGGKVGSGSNRDEEIRDPTFEVAIFKHRSSQDIDGRSSAADLPNNNIGVAISDSTPSRDKIVLHLSAGEKELGSRSDKALETSETNLNSLPSLEMRDENDISPRSVKTLTGNHSPNGLMRRKSQKVRLLTDILDRQVNLEGTNAKAERTTPVDKAKKRKMSQEDECNVSKKVRSSSNGGAERSSSAVEIADSHSDEKDESDGERFLEGSKIPRIKHRNGTSKKKKDNVSSNGYVTVNGLVRSANCSSTGEKVEPRLMNNFQSMVGTDKNSDLCWNTSNNLPGKSSTVQKNVVPMTTDAAEMLTFQPARESSAKVRLDLSLNSFRDSEKRTEDVSRNMTSWSFVPPKGKDNNTPELGQSSRKGVIYDLNQGISQTPPTWQETPNPIMLQKGNLHVPVTMEMVQHQRREANHKEFLGHQRCQQSEKTIVQGLSSDDIPMEIVELMAKNQYERRLSEAIAKCTAQRTEMYNSCPGVTSFHHANANTERPPVKLFGTFPQTSQGLSGGPNRGLASTHLQSGVWFPTGQGRTISDIKSGDARMQNADLNVKGVGPIDPYSNDAIPALQLLSLMDRGMPTPSNTSPFNLDTNKLLEKPFSPCSYHPRFHLDGNKSILNGSYLSHHQLKESPGVHPAGSPGVHSGSYYADQISFKSRGQEKSRKSFAPGRFGGSKFERFASSSNGLLSVTGDAAFPKMDEQNRILGMSSSRLHDHNASKVFARADLQVKSSSKSEICSLNRNPAEFSLPEEGNQFTWSIKDQRVRKKSSATVDLDKRKQRKLQRKEQGPKTATETRFS